MQDIFEQLFLQSSDCILIGQLGGSILRANAAACSALGRSEGELLETDITELVEPTPELQAQLATRVNGNVARGETTFRRQDGSTFPCEFSSAILELEGERLVYAVFRDITARKAAAAALAEQHARHDAYFNSLREAVGILAPVRDAQGAITTFVSVEANRAMHLAMGREQVPGHTVEEFHGPRAPERIATFRRVLETGVPEEYAQAWDDRHNIARVFRVADDLIGITLIDVTAQQQAERAQAATLARFDAFMAASPAICSIKDAQGRMVYMNAACERALGLTLDEVRGRTIHELRPALDVPQLRESELAVLQTGESSVELVPFLDVATGWQRWWHVTRFAVDDGSGGRLIGGLATDVTEQRAVEEALRTSEATARAALADLERAQADQERAEEKLRQSQKMEAIGQLAGGVAHDFNNLLTVILGNGELLEEQLEGDPLQPEVRQIIAAADRAATLTRQLLAFSRKQALEPRVLNVNTIVRGMEGMLHRLLGEDIELAFLLVPEPHLCLVDPGQIEQVVLNLVVNARDAMPEGGRLTIETANVSFDSDYVARHPDTMIGAHLMLSISDTGTGMDAATQARLFEPFFTTKPVGRGTGLGLSTVYGIVKQTGGSIWVYSEPGHGTTFKVYLPESREVEDVLPVKPAAHGAYRGSETILLAEDDPLVRATVAGMLRRAGYHVIEAGNGGEALLICEQHGTTIDLLVTDVVMPRMNGRQLAERLRVIRPELLVLFISGYTANVVVHHGVVDSGVNFLQKPLTAEVLLPKVRQVLDRGVARR